MTTTAMTATTVAATTKPATTKPAMENKPILLIEDSPSQALRFWLLLAHAGYNVHIVGDGREGWKKACEEQPCLILLDLYLPGMSGLQVLTRLKHDRTTADIPVIILSNDDSVSQVEQAIALGATDYLFKADYMRTNAGCQLQEAINQILLSHIHHGRLQQSCPQDVSTN